MKIGVIGLGKLGLPLALVLSKHFKVIGYDKQKEVIQSINKKLSPILEPQVQEHLEKYPFKASNNPRDLNSVQVCFIIVPTPSKKSGKFSNFYVNQAIKIVKNYAKKCKLVVINSTVMPGTCSKIKKKLSCELCYNPEFIALGSVIRDLENPDFMLIGESNKQAGDLLESIYKKVTSSDIQRMDLTSAEIAKISLNSYITMKINFANNLGRIAYNFNADIDKITSTIGRDHRVGLAYLKAGMPYGGPCFPRDNRAFGLISSSTLQDHVDFENRNLHVEFIVKRCEEILGGLKGKEILIWGKSYKPNTLVTEESPSMWLKEFLSLNGAIVRLIDEGDTAYLVPDLHVLAVPSDFVRKGAEIILKFNPNAKILDCWRIRQDLKGRKNYYSLFYK